MARIATPLLLLLPTRSLRIAARPTRRRPLGPEGRPTQRPQRVPSDKLLRWAKSPTRSAHPPLGNQLNPPRGSDSRRNHLLSANQHHRHSRQLLGSRHSHHSRQLLGSRHNQRSRRLLGSPRNRPLLHLDSRRPWAQSRAPLALPPLGNLRNLPLVGPSPLPLASQVNSVQSRIRLEETPTQDRVLLLLRLTLPRSRRILLEEIAMPVQALLLLHPTLPGSRRILLEGTAMPARALLLRRRVAMLNQRIPSVHLQQTTIQTSLPQVRSQAQHRRKTRLRAPLGSQLPHPAQIPLAAGELPQRQQGTLLQLEASRQVAAERHQTLLQQRRPIRRHLRIHLAALQPSQLSLRHQLVTLTRLEAPNSILLRRAT